MTLHGTTKTFEPDGPHSSQRTGSECRAFGPAADRPARCHNQPASFKAEKLAQISMQLRRLNEQPVFDLTNYSEVQRYAAARQQVARSLKEFAIALGNRDNANGAWRSRSLRRQSEAAVMRAQVPWGPTMPPPRPINRLVGSLSSSLAKALLYRGSRRFAVLEP